MTDGVYECFKRIVENRKKPKKEPVIDGYKGEVHSVSVLRQKIKVIITDDKGDKEIREYKAEEVKFKPRKRRERVELSKEELKALKDLEKDEGESKL